MGASAFGLNVTGAGALIGFGGTAAAAQPRAPAVAVEVTEVAALGRRWPSDATQRLADTPRNGRAASMSIDAHPRAGYLMRGSGYGRALISAPADRVALAPGRASRWRMQRYLIGQVLPFAAGLHGIEQLHAGAVTIDGAAVALVGPSGAGKSSLIAALVNRGAQLLADDVLALSVREGRVVGNPGPGVLIISEPGLELQTRPPGDIVARAEGELAVALRVAEPAPIEAVCFLELGSRRISVDATAAGDPRRLLGSAYEVVRRDPTRLRTQLDLMAQLASGTRLLRVRRPATARPDAVARALLAELGRRP